MKNFIYKLISTLALCVKSIIIWVGAILVVMLLASVGICIILPVITVGALIGGE